MIGTPHIWRRMLGTRGRFGILQRVPGAAAAFSLARLNDSEIDPVVNTLRNSDGAEKFWHPQEILWGHATEWAKEEVLKYLSDFSATENYTESNGIGEAAQTIDGVNGAYKFTLTGGFATHQTSVPSSPIGITFQTGNQYRVEFDYYIPNTNAAVNSVRVIDTNGVLSQVVTNVGVWSSSSVTFTASAATTLFFRASSSGIDGDGDWFGLKNVRVTQLTSDLLVTDLYEQQNGINHASQIDEAKMPKLIEAGVMVTKNGLPAIKFHATTVRLEALINATQPFTVIQTMADITTNGLYYDSSAGRSYSRQSANTNWLSFSGAEVNAGIVADLSGHMIASILHNRDESILRRNGVTKALVGDIGPNTMGTLVINASAVFKLQDLIVYDDDITANIAAIEKDRMDYYKIPQP